MLQLRHTSLIARHSLCYYARAGFHSTALLRTPPTATQPERNAQPTATSPAARFQQALSSVGSTVDSFKQRLPDTLKEYKFERPSRGVVWGAAGATVLLGGMWLLSGDDGSDDPVLGRPNPADRAYLSQVPTSKLISGWM